MLFGDKKKFGVQIELGSQYGGVWLYGNFCYWINNEMIGDFDMGTSLRDVLFQMKFASSEPLDRSSSKFCSLSSQDFFNYLDDELYGNIDSENVDNDEDLWKFDISIHVDIFDLWKIYLLDCRGFSKILYKNINIDEIKIFELESGYFNEVVKTAFNYLNFLYEEEC